MALWSEGINKGKGGLLLGLDWAGSSILNEHMFLFLHVCFPLCSDFSAAAEYGQ